MPELSMVFAGIPAEAFDFYEGLTADNSKVFWSEHKTEYEQYVKAPLQELAKELGPEFGEAHLYRPYRDLRFSKDKTPYKDHQGMFVESEHGLGWYVQVSLSGLMIAGGWYMSDSKQLSRYREQIADDSGPKLQEYLDVLAAAGFEIGGDQLKTKPRGIDADHPQIELLRYKSLYASKRWDPAAWMGTSECEERVVTGWRELSPWLVWLAQLVGDGQPPLGSRNGKGRTDTH
jgi:uncharacterized protein (TIGR02453 family)